MLNVFSFLVLRVAQGGKELGPFTKPIYYFSSFPKTVIEVLKSTLSDIPPTYVNKDLNFHNLNSLKYDLFGLNSTYNVTYKNWEVRLFNFKNDSIIYSWHLNKNNFYYSNRQFTNSPPKNCLLLTNKSLIVSMQYTKNLYRLDRNSNIIWHITSRYFHHSLNLDADSNLWICTYDLKHFKDNTGEYSYWEDFITKVNVKTGEIIYEKSIPEILIENGYKNYIYGFSDNLDQLKGNFDPTHLNDIQPVLVDGPYFKKGDLFISIRNKSLVFLYRTLTNKIIYMLSGPFLLQHDVDILSNKEISIFNNNVTELGFRIDKDKNQEIAESLFSTSEILIYNFEDSTYRKCLAHHFQSEKISTFSEGSHEKLSNGDVYVESQNNGKIYIMNNNVVKFRKQFNTLNDNWIEKPQWIRIYEDINF